MNPTENAYTPEIMDAGDFTSICPVYHTPIEGGYPDRIEGDPMRILADSRRTEPVLKLLKSSHTLMTRAYNPRMDGRIHVHGCQP